MTLRRRGFVDSYVDARLTHLTGAAYPAPPAGLYIALLRGTPLSDGSDAAGLELARVGPVTYRAPATVPGNEAGQPDARYIEPSGPVTITPPGTPAPGLSRTFRAWALYGQPTGGTPIYVGHWAGSLVVGVATTLPASTFRVRVSEA
jgi:hypothetical protein